MEKQIILNNGVKMPRVGLGTYKLQEPRRQVREAIEEGYRLIDTALDYDNEVEVGQGIRDSGIPREEIFLTTKVWFRWFQGHEARRQALECMERLGVDYLDMLMIHWPFNDYYAAYRDLEDLYKEGKIRTIGVCNFNPDRLIDLLSFNEIKMQVNQVETHVYCQRKEEHEWFAKYDVAHQAYSPLGANRIGGFLDEPLLVELAEKYRKTPAQVALRFLLQNDVCIIPRTNTHSRMKENLDLFDFELENGDMERLSALDRGQKVIGNPEDPKKTIRAIEVYR